MDIFKSINNIKNILSSFSLKNDIKVIPATGNDSFSLLVKVIPPKSTVILNLAEVNAYFYQIAEGDCNGVLHIADLDTNNGHINERQFPIKTGDSFIFESHIISKIENLGKKRLVVILGSHTSNCFTFHENNINLTDRQLQVLFFLLRGKTIKQIAKILELSNRTVDDYLEQLRIKFSAQNKYDLISKAINYGYLNVVPESLFGLQLATKL